MAMPEDGLDTLQARATDGRAAQDRLLAAVYFAAFENALDDGGERDMVADAVRIAREIGDE